jgi:hypothetical protein
MLYREIIAVCSQIHIKHINALCGQNVDLLNVKLVVHIVTTGLWRFSYIVSYYSSKNSAFSQHWEKKTRMINAERVCKPELPIHAMKPHGRVKVQLHPFLISTLDGGGQLHVPAALSRRKVMSVQSRSGRCRVGKNVLSAPTVAQQSLGCAARSLVTTATDYISNQQ